MLAPLFVSTALLMAPALEEPWGCGETFVVSQGNNSNTSHFGLEEFAWDFGMGEGEYVHAVAGGTVLMVREDSTSGGCSSTFGSDANRIVIDHGDGTAGLYLHFAPNSTPLSVGDTVRTGDLIGRVGLTGYVCGAHLHYQTQTLCGSWYCQSVMASFDDYGVPSYLDSMLSDNCVPCEAVLDGDVTQVDEADFGCFSGAQPSWTSAVEGLGAHHLHASSATTASATGTWRFGVEVPGIYALEVHIPSNFATADVAYQVVHDEGSTDVAVNQVDVVGWHPLGEFQFGLGEEDPRVELSNESAVSGMRVGYDAIRLTFVEGVDEPDETDGGGSTTDTGSTGDVDPSGSDTATATTGLTSDGENTSSNGSGAMSGSDNDGGDTFPPMDTSASSGPDMDALPGGFDEVPDGCACTASKPQNGGPGALGLLLTGLLAARRRRD